MTEYDIDNLLVQQKNKLIDFIDQLADLEGDSLDLHCKLIVAKLETVASLWEACSYGYKLREMCDRAINWLDCDKRVLEFRQLRDESWEREYPRFEFDD